LLCILDFEVPVGFFRSLFSLSASTSSFLKLGLTVLGRAFVFVFNLAVVEDLLGGVFALFTTYYG